MENKPQPDKFKATWVSNSSLRDFLNCPRLYYLRNVYKDPLTKNKLALMEPPLALGLAVHDILEKLSSLPVEDRLKLPLLAEYKTHFENDFQGEKGGFRDKAQEGEYFERGRQMIQRVIDNPGPIANKTIKIKSDFVDLPYYWLDEGDNIILCGKIDWLEYLEDEDKVHIVDFKTGKHEEKEDSLQLPIYLLIASNTQSREIAKASYWYLDHDNDPKEVILPSILESKETVLKHAKRMKLAKQLDRFVCPTNGCRHCAKYEEVFAGKGKLVGKTSYQDVYILQ